MCARSSQHIGRREISPHSTTCSRTWHVICVSLCNLRRKLWAKKLRPPLGHHGIKLSSVLAWAGWLPPPHSRVWDTGFCCWNSTIRSADRRTVFLVMVSRGTPEFTILVAWGRINGRKPFLIGCPIRRLIWRQSALSTTRFRWVTLHRFNCLEYVLRSHCLNNKLLDGLFNNSFFHDFGNWLFLWRLNHDRFLQYLL